VLCQKGVDWFNGVQTFGLGQQLSEFGFGLSLVALYCKVETNPFLNPFIILIFEIENSIKLVVFNL
jgi:hypothetical protein